MDHLTASARTVKSRQCSEKFNSKKKLLINNDFIYNGSRVIFLRTSSTESNRKLCLETVNETNFEVYRFHWILSTFKHYFSPRLHHFQNDGFQQLEDNTPVQYVIFWKNYLRQPQFIQLRVNSSQLKNSNSSSGNQAHSHAPHWSEERCVTTAVTTLYCSCCHASTTEHSSCYCIRNLR